MGILRAFRAGFTRSPVPDDPTFDGFRAEGAAMASAFHQMVFDSTCFDRLLERNRRQVYTILVGAGWAAARWPKRGMSFIERLDPLLGWLTFDGWGFHDTMFSPSILDVASEAPARLTGYQRRVWDQGAGRAAWFTLEGNAARIALHFSRFPRSRQADLWSGAGLACTYGGVADAHQVEILRKASGHHRCHLAQGSAFGAKARVLAGHVPPHTRDACQLLCGLTAHEAAKLTDDAMAGLSGGVETIPAYESWRQRVKERFEEPAC